MWRLGGQRRELEPWKAVGETASSFLFLSLLFFRLVPGITPRFTGVFMYLGLPWACWCCWVWAVAFTGPACGSASPCRVSRRRGGEPGPGSPAWQHEGSVSLPPRTQPEGPVCRPRGAPSSLGLKTPVPSYHETRLHTVTLTSAGWGSVWDLACTMYLPCISYRHAQSTQIGITWMFNWWHGAQWNTTQCTRPLCLTAAQQQTDSADFYCY